MADGLDVKQAHVLTAWPHDRPLISCRFDPQGRYVFASSEDSTVQRWTVADGAKTPLAAHESWVLSMAFTPDGETIVTSGCDGRLIWWPVAAEQPTPARSIDAHQGWIRSTAASPDGTLLATGGNDRAARVWNIADGSLMRELAGHERPVYCVQFTPGGEFLLTGDLQGVVKQWNVADWELVRSFDAAALHTYHTGQQVDFGGVRTLAISQDQKYLAAGGTYKATNPYGAVHEPLVLHWEWESQKLLQSHIAEGITQGVVWRSVFLADGTLASACGGASGGWLLFHTKDQDKDVHRFQLPNLARDMDLHPDGVRVATTHFDSHLRISRLAAPLA